MPLGRTSAAATRTAAISAAGRPAKGASTATATRKKAPVPSQLPFPTLCFPHSRPTTLAAGSAKERTSMAGAKNR